MAEEYRKIEGAENIAAFLGDDHWLTSMARLPFWTDPGPERIDQIEHRLACLCTFMDQPPWRGDEVEDGDSGYFSGEVFGGENAEYCICETSLPATAEFIGHAPDDIRWLIDRVRELEARLGNEVAQ